MPERLSDRGPSPAASERMRASSEQWEIDLVSVSLMTPTRLPDALRAASQQALSNATDPLNRLDYNPYIGDEWTIVANELWALAARLEHRFGVLFDGDSTKI